MTLLNFMTVLCLTEEACYFCDTKTLLKKGFWIILDSYGDYSDKTDILYRIINHFVRYIEYNE